MIKYLGVTLEKLRDSSSKFGLPSMRMYEMFRGDRFQPVVAEEAVTAIARDFNMVRVVVGAGHLNYPEVGPAYIVNLKLFFKICVDKGLWIMPNLWTGGVYPDEIVFSMSDVYHYRWNPMFRSDGVERYNKALDTLLEILQPFKTNVHHIDLRNEIQGHIAQFEDEEWTAAKEKHGYEWDYIPDHVAPFWRTWLARKYGDATGVNAAWASKFRRIIDIPVFHTWTIAKAKVEHPKVALADQQSWVIDTVRAWVDRHANTVRAAGFKVGQCTTSDSNSMTVNTAALRISDYIRQSTIGDLVDVLDFHAYGALPAQAVKKLQDLYPNQEIILGEIHLDHPRIVEICQSGVDGLVAWSTGCMPGKDGGHDIHFWDDWRLTPSGESFLAAVKPYLDLYSPPSLQQKEMTFLIKEGSVTIGLDTITIKGAIDRGANG